MLVREIHMLGNLANHITILDMFINLHIQQVAIYLHIRHIITIIHGRYSIDHLEKLDPGENIGEI